MKFLNEMSDKKWWVSKVNQYEQALTNERCENGGYQIDEISYAKGGEGVRVTSNA